MPPEPDAGEKMKRTVIMISSSDTDDTFIAGTDVLNTYHVLGGNATPLFFASGDRN